MDREALSKFLKAKLTLRSLELFIVDVPQKTVFKSAIGVRESRKALILKWVDNDGAVGYGECSCRPDPFYSHEFVDGAIAIIKDYIQPLLKNIHSYESMLMAMQRIRGWNFTKAAVEFAANDLLRRKTGKGLLDHAGIQPLAKVPVGISLGLFDNAAQLRARIADISDAGYQRLKFKITRGYTDPKILSFFASLDFPNIAFDANGAFHEDSFSDLSLYAGLNRIIEQPYPPASLYLHQEYLKTYPDFKMCLDEEIESYGDLVQHSLEMQQLNIKPGRVGGLWNTLQMIEFCSDHGIDAWVGGMFETSIGRALNLQVAALLPEAKAHDLSPSSRYFTRDLVTEPIAMTDGFIHREAFNNITIDQEALEELTIEKIILSFET